MVDGLKTGRHMEAETLHGGVTDHVPCGIDVNGYAHWVVCMERIKIWRLAGLYAEDMSARTRTRVISVAVWLVCMGSAFKISGVIADVSNLSGLSYVPTILFWEETAFAKEMADLRPVSLFT